MGIFKKLFGDSTAQSSNDINSNDKEDHEQQVTNSMSQSAHDKLGKLLWRKLKVIA